MSQSHFSHLSKYMRTWLTYSQVFGKKATKEEIIKDIQSINLPQALTILAKYSVLNQEGKRTLMTEMKPFIQDKEFLDAAEPLDLINLLYSVKWFIAYGNQEKKSTYNNKHSDSFNVFLTILKIADYLESSIDSLDDVNVENQVLKSWLFNRPGEIDKALIRQHVMFEQLARNKENFESYVDIHSIFEKEFGYSIKEYVSTVFALHQPTIKELNLKDVMTDIPWGIDSLAFFEKSNRKEISLKIAQELSTDISSLKDWAKESLDNPYDYEKLLTTPLFRNGNYLIPFSPGFLNSTIFDGLCFKLNTSCRKNKKDFFSFFGHLFEQYVSRVLEAAVQESPEIPYQFIDEFVFEKDGNKKSSDAYLKLGKSLLIIECKGGRLRKETKVFADQEISKKDYEKYALDPVAQANTAYKRILETTPEKFEGIEKVFIFSVSLQAFPKVPSYNQLLDQIRKDLHPHIIEVDYIGLSDLELLALIISKFDFSVFDFISSKKESDEFIPYPNYFHSKYGEIRRTDFLRDALKESLTEITRTLFK